MRKIPLVVVAGMLLALIAAGCPGVLPTVPTTDDRPCAQADDQSGAQDDGQNEGQPGDETVGDQDDEQDGGQTGGQDDGPNGGQTTGQNGGQTADAAAGQAFFEANNCAACHGADASGEVGPSLVGESSADILDRLDGTQSHTGGTVDGVTQQDADNLAAWLATL